MVAEINGLSGNIAELNAEILKMESAGRDTATLRDYRENLIRTSASTPVSACRKSPTVR